MFNKIAVPAIVLSSSVFAADITQIPFETAEGKKTSLADFKGKVVLIVNVASRCGFTKQYEGLQKLYAAKKSEGLVILAFPCNDFGGQEPGSIEEIQAFCKSTYDVDFPIMQKVHVKGEGQHELFKAITGKEGVLPGDIKWNFGKILIDKNGKPIARYEALTSPDGKSITKDIEAALAAN
jgi:glutathione peroxidase